MLCHGSRHRRSRCEPRRAMLHAAYTRPSAEMSRRADPNGTEPATRWWPWSAIGVFEQRVAVRPASLPGQTATPVRGGRREAGMCRDLFERHRRGMGSGARTDPGTGTSSTYGRPGWSPFPSGWLPSIAMKKNTVSSVCQGGSEKFCQPKPSTPMGARRRAFPKDRSSLDGERDPKRRIPSAPR